MQRKNNLLKPVKKRGGFAMIMAITVLVLMATIMAASLAMSAKTTKSTVDLYVYEQSVLLSKSAAEYALLYISKNGCVNNLNFKHDYYDINIDMKYIFSTASTCEDYFQVTTPEQSGSVLMDVTVSVTDPKITSEPIKYFRRTIQKL